MKAPGDQQILRGFSKHLFWDVDRRSLNLAAHRQFIVQRVLEHGFIEDWQLLRKAYSLATIARTAQKLRTLDPKALAFVSCVCHVREDTFRCYSTKQSLPKHWVC
jgi:hypothetical protein